MTQSLISICTAGMTDGGEWRCCHSPSYATAATKHISPGRIQGRKRCAIPQEESARVRYLLRRLANQLPRLARLPDAAVVRHPRDLLARVVEDEPARHAAAGSRPACELVARAGLLQRGDGVLALADDEDHARRRRRSTSASTSGLAARIRRHFSMLTVRRSSRSCLLKGTTMAPSSSISTSSVACLRIVAFVVGFVGLWVLLGFIDCSV